MRRPLLSAALAVTIGALALAGCGRTDTPASGTGEEATTLGEGAASGKITVWAMGAEGDALPDFVNEFTQANPDVTVEVTAIPWGSAHDKLQTAIAAGTGPDIAQMGTTWMTDFSTAFATVPQGVDTSDMFEGSLATTTVDGVALGVPWYVDTRVLYYRTDMAEAAGWTTAPTSWEELHRMASDLQSKGGAQYGIGLPGSENDAFQNSSWMVWSAGGSLMNADGSAWTLDTPEVVDAFTYLQSFYTDGIANPDADADTGANTQEFVAGTTPMFVDGPYMIGQLAEVGGADFADKYATAPLPTEKSATSFAGGSNLVVFKNSPNAEAAWKLIQWLSQPDTQVKWFQATGDLPATQSSWDDPALTEVAKLQAFGDQLKDTNSPPSNPTWSRVAAAGDQVVERLVHQQLTPEEAAANLQSEADSIGVQ